MDEEAEADRRFDDLFPAPLAPGEEAPRRARFASPDLGFRRSYSGFLTNLGLGARPGVPETKAAEDVAAKPAPSFYDFVFGAAQEEPMLLSPATPRGGGALAETLDTLLDLGGPPAPGGKQVTSPSGRPPPRGRGDLASVTPPPSAPLQPPDAVAVEGRPISVEAMAELAQVPPTVLLEDPPTPSPSPSPPPATRSPASLWQHHLFGFESHHEHDVPPVVAAGFLQVTEQAREPSLRSLGETSVSSAESGASTTTRILTRRIMAQLAPSLPALTRTHNWKLLYSLRSHGASFSTLGRHVARYDATLLLLRTAEFEILGGFGTRAWELAGDEKDATYYGTGQSFLFRVEEGGVRVFPWSRKNSYFQLSSLHCVAFGAGGADFGLYLGRDGLGYDLATGSSGACDTYDNEPLASISGRDFAIVDMEVWAPTHASSEDEALREERPADKRRRRRPA